jgi:imidazolonepropionase-like amidohydrolase
MSSDDEHPCGEGDSAETRRADLCDELRILSGEVAHRAGEDMALVGACAIHSGVQLMLRKVSEEVVATWLEAAAAELRSSGRLSVPRALRETVPIS